MARTAKTLQHALFAKLRTAFTGKDVGRHAIDIDAPRWIQGTAEEQDALTRGKVLHSVEVLGHGPLALLEWGGASSAQSRAHSLSARLRVSGSQQAR
jgi:hypothetical protein